MKNMTVKEAALELALMILHSVIPSKEATELMDQLEALASHSLARDFAKHSFNQAKAIYDSLHESKAQHMFIVPEEDLPKLSKFKDHLLAVHDNIFNDTTLVIVKDWGTTRDMKTLLDGRIAFQLSVCTSNCSGCSQRKSDALAAFQENGVAGEVERGSGDYMWAYLPKLPEGKDLKGYLEESLKIKIQHIYDNEI